MNVHILVNHFAEEEFSGMVFKTLRVGFPTLRIVVWNQTDKTIEGDFRVKTSSFKTHSDWIKYLIETENESFILCDTDIVFYASMEDDFLKVKNVALYGRLLPKFYDVISQAISLPRFHPSLLLINPIVTRYKIAQEKALSYSHDVDTYFVESFYFYANNQRYFSDTMASLTGLLMFCKPFSEVELNKYCHLFCGTFLNKASKVLGLEFKNVHKEVSSNPNAGKGLWKQQEAYFYANQSL
jgi:uncharacterized protein (DUF736 family)